MDRRKSIKAIALGSLASGLVLDACKSKEPAAGDAKVAAGENAGASKGVDRQPEEVAHFQKVNSTTFFTEHEMATITILADIIIPKDEVSGSASEAGVPEFIEFIVKDMPDHQTPMRGGLRWLDLHSHRRFEKSFSGLTAEQRISIVDEIAYPKKAKPEVKVGISPFGIWKPGYPASVQGFNQYEKLYADAKLWLNEGWCDYYSPQLYWPIHAKQQSFPALLQWWVEQNTKGRTIAPGIFTSRIGDKNRPFTVEQIEDQVFLARTLQGSSGTIHFSMKAIMENREGLSDRLKANTYLTPALTPQTPWLSVDKTPAPKLSIARPSSPEEPTTVSWQRPNPNPVRRWCVYRLIANRWEVSIYGVDTLSLTIDPAKSSDNPENKVQAIAVAGVDGAGTLGPATIQVID